MTGCLRITTCMAIEFNELSLGDTRLSRESIHRLLQKHQVECLGIENAPFSDAEAELFSSNVGLRFLVLRGTDMTDAGFSRPEPVERTSAQCR